MLYTHNYEEVFTSLRDAELYDSAHIVKSYYKCFNL